MKSKSWLRSFLLKNGATSGRGFFEYCCPLLDNLIPIEVAGMGNRGRSERSAERIVAQQTIQARSQIGIRAGQESGSAVDHVIGAVKLHGNRRQAAGCGLQQYLGIAFLDAGKKENVGAAHLVSQLFWRKMTEERDVAASS